MNKKLLLPALLLLFIGSAIAQKPTGALTIFSEDGNKFFLILNGERQNNVAQTNLRLEDLTQPYYTAKIIFEDKALPEINKNMLQVADFNNVMNDVTYKIKKDKSGNLNLKYFSSLPMQQGYVAPSNVVVMHYGAPVGSVPGGETITRTTTTTGATTPTSVNMNVNGMNMGLNISNPNMTGTTQTTTSQTTTTTTSGSNAMMESNRAVVASGCAGAFPMNSGNFVSALNTIKSQGFDDTKLSTAKQIASSNCLSADQISSICKEFGFEDKKLDFAKFAYTHCTEPSNYFKINNVFSFSASTDDLNKYIQNK